MSVFKSAALLLVVAVVATACLGGSGEAAAPPADDLTLAFEADSEPTDAGDGAPHEEPQTAESSAPDPSAVPGDRPCEGGAFPGDDEFRELLCAVQWAQIDLLRAGGDIDPSWGERSGEAILLYGTDRAEAIAELEAVLAEMGGAIPDVADPVDDLLELGAVEDAAAATQSIRDCMVDVAQLIVDANAAGVFDPVEVDAWQSDVDTVEALIDNGDLAGAEQAVCELRDEIAAALEDPSLIPG